MVALLDLSDAPVRAFSLSEGPAVYRVRLEAGGQTAEAQPMLWPTGVDQIDSLHAAVAPAPDVDLYVLSNVKVAGPGAHLMADGAYLYAPTLFPAYIRGFTRDDILVSSWAHPEATTGRKIPVGIAVAHFNFVFGHFLLEMFPKLLLLKHHLPHLRRYPILLPSNTPAFVRKIIAEVLGAWPVVFYDYEREHLEVERLIAPGMCHVDYQFHPAFTALIDQHVRWAHRPAWADVPTGLKAVLRGRPPLPTGQAGRRLFVSRRHTPSAFRSLENAAELEAIARAHGFAVVHPETLSWRRQVRLFSGADYVIGEFGSGMHNTLFSRPGTQVVCFNWIVEVQSRIANFRGQGVGYLLPPDNQPRLFSL
ncbi:MAG: capsular polysaccharide biosynthesis protein, partial [Caulobacter sp.]|nr:capsular polysaccharide biosynthesis protein [Caulobacter sp.]